MSRSCWCWLCVSVPCGHMCRSIAKPSLPFLPLPCNQFKQAGLKCVFFSFSDSSFPFHCNYHNFSLFTHVLSHPWPRVPMAFPFSSTEAGEGGFVPQSSPTCHPTPQAWEPKPLATVPALGCGQRPQSWRQVREA